MQKKSISLKWSKIIKSWEQSGLTQKRFCEENGLNLNTFYYYRKNLDIKKKINHIYILSKKY